MPFAKTTLRLEPRARLIGSYLNLDNAEVAFRYVRLPGDPTPPFEVVAVMREGPSAMLSSVFLTSDVRATRNEDAEYIVSLRFLGGALNRSLALGACAENPSFEQAVMLHDAFIDQDKLRVYFNMGVVQPAPGEPCEGDDFRLITPLVLELGYQASFSEPDC